MTSPFLRLWLLRLILSLPKALLRFLSGGGVIYSAGRTLDAQIQFLWRNWFSSGEHTAYSLSGRPIEQVRQEWQDISALLGLPKGVRVRVEPAAGSTPGSIGGLLIRPPSIAADAPLLVFFHQGGGVMGGPDLSKAFCALFAVTARCPVFLPEYRLAPAHRFPAPHEDARIAWDWAVANATRLGSKSGDVAVGGATLGAALAARLCLDLKRDFKPMPVGQLLLTPLLDLADPHLQTASEAMWPIATSDLEAMISHHAGAGVDLSDPRLSPGREALLVGQPPSLIASAGFDPLAPQAEAYARRLTAARCRAIYRRYDTLPLGFDLLTGVSDEAQMATRALAAEWMQLLRSNRAEAEPAQEVA